MSSVSQLVPNYVLGISDQPDELKRPGQVRESVNTFPDVTFGLTKRPGLDFLKTLTLPPRLDDSADDGNGTWFNYFRSNSGIGQEEYLGYVTSQGKVKMWSAKTGTEMKVNYLKSIVPVPDSGPFNLSDQVTSYIPKYPDPITRTDEIKDEDMIKPDNPKYNLAYAPYLQHQNRKSIKHLTINDYTFLTNREIPVSMSGTKSDLPGGEQDLYEAFIDIRTLAYNRDYVLAFDEPGAKEGETEVTTAKTVQLLAEWYPTSGTPCYAGSQTKTLSSGSDKKGLKVNFSTGCKSIASEGPDGYWTLMSTNLTLFSGGTGWEVGDQVVTSTTYGGSYRIRVNSVDTAKFKASLGVANAPSPSDASSKLTVQSLLTVLEQEIKDIKGWETVEQIGNGIYVTRKTPFTVSTPEADLFNILSLSESNVQTAYMATDNIASLPTQCKHNVVCKILNSGSSSDDYFVKFKGDLEQDGRGVWEETRQPGLDNAFNTATMPHQIIRMSTVDLTDPDDPIVTFLISDIQYDDREVGDADTAKQPTFVSKPINNIMFFRNRLVFLSDENIIMSRPADYFNFWAVSAIAASPKDPVDISASTTYASVLFDGVSINNGLVLFSEYQQFLLTTDSDVLDTTTAKVTPIGAYNYDKIASPFRMGGTFGWIGTETNFSKFNEMAEVFREGEPKVVENSTIIKKRFIGKQTEIASSKESGICMFSAYDSNNTFLFRFFDNGQERALASWSQWKLPDKLQFHAIVGDYYFAVCKAADGKYHLVRLSITDGFLSFDSGSNPVVYPVALDYKEPVAKADITYDSKTKQSTFALTVPKDTTKQLAVVSKDAGRYLEATIDGTNVVLDGDWTDSDLFVGYNIECKIELPTFFVQQNEANRVRSQTTKDLVVHRAKFSFADIGYYTIHLDRLGMDNYNFDREFRFADSYKASGDYVLSKVEETVPIYTRNTSFNITISSNHPSPFILYSMTWEGDFNQRYYKGV